MLQTYSRLFRPWDAADSSERRPAAKQYKSDSVKVKTENETVRRVCDNSNRLRKIRSCCKSNQIKSAEISSSRKAVHQDSTVTTTTEDDVESKELSERLGHVESLFKKPNKLDCSTLKDQASFSHCPERALYEPYLTHPSYPLDVVSHAELAHSLGVPPTDPLLLESFAQGYAMELEYARIMHQESQNKLMNAKKQRPKKYRCPHCNVGFSNNGQLKGHIRIHTGERPFKCEDKNCGKTFTRNEELTRHRRIHSGLRPYPCPTCGKKFGRRDHLKKHTRTHAVQAERMMPMFVPITAMGCLTGYPYLYGY